MVWLWMRLGDTVYRFKFLIADPLAVNVLVGTWVLNKRVIAMRCMAQQVCLRGATIPILGTMIDQHPSALRVTKGDDEDEEMEIRPKLYPIPRTQDTDSDDMVTNRIGLAKKTTLQPFTKRSGMVNTQASNLVFVDNLVNSLAEFTKEKPFEILISNFTNSVRKVPKGMVIASEASNPRSIVSLRVKVDRRIPKCLNILTEDAVQWGKPN